MVLQQSPMLRLRKPDPSLVVGITIETAMSPFASISPPLVEELRLENVEAVDIGMIGD